MRTTGQAQSPVVSAAQDSPAGRSDYSCCAPVGLRAEVTRQPALGTQGPAHKSPPDRLVRLPGRRFRVGSDDRLLPMDGEGPSRLVGIKAFAVDPFAVTNQWFAAFVADTGFRTDAEQHGWSAVFQGFLAAGNNDNGSAAGAPWWRRVEGTAWNRPEGPGSTIEDRLDHPVVHVSWHDAQAFAAWAGGRLPSEAEWELAAGGGLEARRFPWGHDEPDDDRFMPCNIWQGEFPNHNTVADGYAGTAPVSAFAPNGLGLFNMVGNTWEWCADAFRVRSLARAAKARNEASRRHGERLIKGGSYLCHRSYCYRYRTAARSGVSPDTSTGHLGFRLVFDIT